MEVTQDPGSSEPNEAYLARINPILDAFEQMQPEEVVASYRFHCDEEEDYDYTEALLNLPGRNPAFGRAVYATFAESPNVDNRKEIIMCLPRLCLIDRAAGVTLWNHLIRDSDDEVRHLAYDELHNLIDTPSGQEEKQERQREEWIGATWQDITNLYRAYLKAEHSAYTRYSPGNTPPAGQV